MWIRILLFILMLIQILPQILHIMKNLNFFLLLFTAASQHCFIFLVSVVSDNNFQYFGQYIEIVRKNDKFALNLDKMCPDPDPQHWQKEALH